MASKVIVLSCVNLPTQLDPLAAKMFEDFVMELRHATPTWHWDERILQVTGPFNSYLVADIMNRTRRKDNSKPTVVTCDLMLSYFEKGKEAKFYMLPAVSIWVSSTNQSPDETLMRFDLKLDKVIDITAMERKTAQPTVDVTGYTFQDAELDVWELTPDHTVGETITTNHPNIPRN